MRTSAILAVCSCVALSGGLGQSPPAGTLVGRPFTARAVELRALGVNTVKAEGKVLDKAQAYVLEFKGTDEFMPDESIELWFATDVGQKLEGRKIVCKPVRFGTEAYRAQHYKPGPGSVARGITGVMWSLAVPGRPTVSDNVSEEISAVLQFGKSKNGWIAGAIDLQLPKRHGIRLRGSFMAKTEASP